MSAAMREEVLVAGDSDQQEPHRGRASTPQSFRGPLRYEVETSAPQLEAGKKFSIFVRITNPYDVPVQILGVDTQLPVEFLNPDLDQLGFFASVKNSFRATLAEKLESNAISAVNVSTPPPGLGGLGGSRAPLGLLQPGNASLNKFSVSTRRKNFFIPAAYTFHIQISYEMDGKVNADAIKQQFNIRAPLSALIWGSAWGAIAGAVLRALYADQSLTDAKFFSVLLGGVLLAAVLVIAFARKKDVQPFISVEDFWGGFFVGVVAGYVGKPLIDQYLNAGRSSLPK